LKRSEQVTYRIGVDDYLGLGRHGRKILNKSIDVSNVQTLALIEVAGYGY
jgi:hypothetical protein